MGKKIFNKKGFTLVELLLVIIISGIIFALTFSLQGIGFRSFGMGTTQAEIQRSIRFVDELIRREIRNAIDIGTGSEDVTFENRIEFDESQSLFRFGENASRTFETVGIAEISFEAIDQRTIRYVIIGTEHEFVFTNDIFLNNTSVLEELQINNLLYYNSP